MEDPVKIFYPFNRAIQTGVLGFVNLAHLSGANRRKDFVETEQGTGSKWHI